MNFEITAALSALKTAYDLAKTGLDARDDAKVKAAISDMAEKLAHANLAALELSQRLRALDGQVVDLQAQLREAEQRQRERDRYLLREVRPGAFVYTLNRLKDPITPAHDLCQVCCDAGKKSILQRSPNGRVLYCRVNSAHNVLVAEDPIMGTTPEWGGAVD